MVAITSEDNADHHLTEGTPHGQLVTAHSQHMQRDSIPVIYCLSLKPSAG